MGVGSTTGSRPNSTVGGVSVLEVWAGESPFPRFWPLARGRASAQSTSQRGRADGRGRATKSRVLGRSGAQRRRGVGGKTTLGSGRRGTSGLSSVKHLKPPEEGQRVLLLPIDKSSFTGRLKFPFGLESGDPPIVPTLKHNTHNPSPPSTHY